MMAALAAAKSGDSVTLLEKNEKLGKKLYITGKGRCNLTNDCDERAFLDNVVHNARFMYSDRGVQSLGPNGADRVPGMPAQGGAR